MKNFLSAVVLIIGLIMPEASIADMVVWCAGDSEKIQPYDAAQGKNFFWNGDEKTVRLYGAKNEYVAFQIIVNATGEELSGVDVAANDFISKDDKVIAKNNVDLFKEHYLKVRVPSSVNAKPVEDARRGVYPTQMIPIYKRRKFGAPFDIGENRNQPVWVDLYIPDDAATGEYESSFFVMAKGKEPVRVQVLLTVWDFMLPHETHFRTYIYYGSEQIRWAYGYGSSSDPAFRGLEDGFFQMAHQHRLILCPNIEANWGYNRKRFEEYWYKRGRGAYIDGSAYTKRVGKRTPANTWAAAIIMGDDKKEYQRVAKIVLDFFKEKRMSDMLMLYVYDEPRSKDDYEFIRSRCQLVHDVADKELPCMVTVPIKPPHSSWGSLAGYVDIWNSGDSSWEDIQERMRAGDKIWTYNMGWGGGPYVDTPGISGRTQAWVGWKFGFDGWMFWDSCYWIDTNNSRDSGGKRIDIEEINADPKKYRTKVWEDPMTYDQMRRPGYFEGDALRLNGDGVLFYPGAEIGLEQPVSSFTMKSLRRGLQDYEYLWLAKKLGKEKEIQSIVDRLVPAPKQWNKDVNAWYNARMEVAKEILAALKSKSGKER